jgi:hypothetical protein
MLRGRSAELSLLDELLREGRRVRGSPLVLSGEAGSGKSALLEYARGQAEGLHVLSAPGLGIETPYPSLRSSGSSGPSGAICPASRRHRLPLSGEGWARPVAVAMTGS